MAAKDSLGHVLRNVHFSPALQKPRKGIILYHDEYHDSSSYNCHSRFLLV